MRYQFFERPRFERVAADVYAGVAVHLDALEGEPDGSEGAAHMQALVQCSQPLKNYLTRQFEGASDPRRRLMLEALTRRYYRIRELEGLRVVPVHGRVVAAAEYDHEGRRIHLLTTFAAYAELDRAAEAMVPLVADVPLDEDVVLDLYVWRPGPQPDDDVTQEEVSEVLAGVPFPRRLRRVVVAISGPGRGLGMAGTLHFTYRPVPEGGYREEELTATSIP